MRELSFGDRNIRLELTGPSDAHAFVTAIDYEGRHIDVHTPELTDEQNNAFILGALGVSRSVIAGYIQRSQREVGVLFNEVFLERGANNIGEAITYSFMDGSLVGSDGCRTDHSLPTDQSEVLTHMAAGNKGAMITLLTGFSKDQIGLRRKAIFEELGASSDPEATLLGYASGLINPEEAAIFRPIDAPALPHTPLVKTKHHKMLKEDTPTQLWLRGGIVDIQNVCNLTDEQLRIFLLRSLGIQYKEIATILNIPHDRIESHAVANLHKAFGEPLNTQHTITEAFLNGTYTLRRPAHHHFKDSDRPSLTLLAKGIRAHAAIPLLESGSHLRGKSQVVFHNRAGLPNAVGAVLLGHMSEFLSLDVLRHPLPYIMATEIAPVEFAMLNAKKGIEVPTDWLGMSEKSLLKHIRWQGELITNKEHEGLTDRQNNVHFLRLLGLTLAEIAQILGVPHTNTIDREDDRALAALRVPDHFASATVLFQDKTCSGYADDFPELRKMLQQDLTYLKTLATGVGTKAAAKMLSLKSSQIDDIKRRLTRATGGTSMWSILTAAYVRKLIDPDEINVKYIDSKAS